LGKWHVFRADATHRDAAPSASSSRSLDSWPDYPTYPGGEVSLDFNTIREIDLSTMPLNVLQSSILAAMREFYAQDLPGATLPTTVKDALELLDRAKFLRFRSNGAALDAIRADSDISFGGFLDLRPAHGHGAMMGTK
jgi:hypothetical protein